MVREGIFTLLHFDADPPVDSGPYRRIVTLQGDTAYDGLNDAFNPPPGPGETPVSGSLKFEAEETDYAGLQIFPTVKADLILENEPFVIEGRVRFDVAITKNYRLFSYGGNVTMPAWSIRLQAPKENTNTYTAVRGQWSFIFEWEDRFLVDRYIVFPVANAGQAITFPFTPASFDHFVFQYDPDNGGQFDIWVGGQRVGSKPGSAAVSPLGRPFDGLYCRSVQAESAVCLAIGGPHSPVIAEEFRWNFSGNMDEIRVSVGQLFYAGDSIPVPSAPYPTPDPLPEPEPPEEISLSRCMLGGLQKTYIEETRHTPTLGLISSKPPDREYPENATHEGKLYLYQPNTSFSVVYLYVLININGDNQEPNLVWMPFSSVKFGRTLVDTGTSWKSRRGNRLGEPF